MKKLATIILIVCLCAFSRVSAQDDSLFVWVGGNFQGDVWHDTVYAPVGEWIDIPVYFSGNSTDVRVASLLFPLGINKDYIDQFDADSCQVYNAFALWDSPEFVGFNDEFQPNWASLSFLGFAEIFEPYDYNLFYADPDSAILGLTFRVHTVLDSSLIDQTICSALGQGWDPVQGAANAYDSTSFIEYHVTQYFACVTYSPPSAAIPIGEIACVSDSNGNADIWFLDSDGDNLQCPAPFNAALFSSSNEYYPSLSPSGEYLLFSSDFSGNYELYVAPTGDLESYSALTNLDSPDPIRGNWAPDNDSIAFSSGQWVTGGQDIYLTSRTSLPGEELAILADPGASDETPAWSADGSCLAYIKINPSGSTYRSELYVIDRATLQETRLTDDPGTVESHTDWAPCFNPAGNDVIWESGRSDSLDHDIWRIYNPCSILDTLWEQVTFTGGQQRDPYYSPDGGKIVFVRNDHLYVMNSNGTGQAQITYGSAHFSDPTWGASGVGACDYAAGDVNNSSNYNGLDVTYGVAYFKGGPFPMCADCPADDCNSWRYCGDVNGDCAYNGLDIGYGVNYLKGGPALIPCPDCPPGN